MSFLSSVFVTKAHDLHDKINQTIVNIDPVGSSEAEIQQMVSNVNLLAQSAADAKAKADWAKTIVDSLTADKAKYVAAITLQTSKTPPNEDLINKLLTSAEDVKTKLVAAQAAYDAAQKHADVSVANHHAAVDKLTKMRQALSDAQAALQEAQTEASEADQRRHEAEVAANILKPSDASGSALAIMQQHAAELKKHIDAANMTTDALTHKPDDDVAEALAAVGNPTPTMSVAERLAALG